MNKTNFLKLSYFVGHMLLNSLPLCGFVKVYESE